MEGKLYHNLADEVKNHPESENTVRISNYHTSYGNSTPSLSASQQKFDQLHHTKVCCTQYVG